MKPLIVFTHIEKTSGTSFKESLIKPNLPQGSFLHFNGIRRFRRELTPETVLVAGHMPYGLHWCVRRKVEYITFLRDPIDRAVSHYHFVKQAKSDTYEHPMYKYANSVSLAEFYENRDFQNRQTRFVAGFLAHRLYPRVRTSAFERWVLDSAIRHLRNRYVCFGVLERFPESIELFKQTFGWQATQTVEFQKKTKQRPKVEELDAATRHTLEQGNQLDMRLYEYALKRFEEICAERGVVAESSAGEIV